MWNAGDVWQLLRDEEVIGEVVIEDGDFPWLRGRFVPAAGFAEVQPLFERELALTEEEDWEEFDSVISEINDLLQLVAPTGAVAEFFLLHVEGDHASFRWIEDESLP